MHIPGVGGANFHSSSDPANQALNDFMKQILSIEDSGEASETTLNQLSSDAKTINSSLGSFSPPLNPKFADDIREFASNPSSTSSLLGQLTSVSPGDSDKLQGLSLAIQAQYEGSDSCISEQFVPLLEKIEGSGNMTSTQVDQLRVLTTAFAALQPDNVPTQFLDDCQSFSDNPMSQNSLFGQLANAKGPDQAKGFALAIQAQYEGSDSCITKQFMSLLNQIEGSGTITSTQVDQLRSLSTAFAALHPDNVSAKFLADCESFSSNPEENSTLFGQLANAKDPDQVKSLASQLLSEYEGS